MCVTVCFEWLSRTISHYLWHPAPRCVCVCVHRFSCCGTPDGCCPNPQGKGSTVLADRCLSLCMFFSSSFLYPYQFPKQWLGTRGVRAHVSTVCLRTRVCKRAHSGHGKISSEAFLKFKFMTPSTPTETADLTMIEHHGADLLADLLVSLPVLCVYESIKVF